MPRISVVLKKALLFALALLVLPAGAAWAASPPQPTYGPADVDGSDSDWVSGDLFAITYWTNDVTREKAEVYLRYDCTAQILYIRVKGYQSTYRIDADNDSSAGTADHKVWLNGSDTPAVHGNTGDNNSPPDFAYYNFTASNNTAGGWEASVSLAPGNHTIKVQTVSFVVGSTTENLVSQTKTSGGSLGFIPLVIECAQYDWGDLPANYNMTLNANNGARHQIGSLWLGATIDAESDGQPHASALGDDNNGIDDEDGVVPTPGVVWAPGVNGGSVDVWVTGGNGCLYGWMDWNKSGGMGGAGEFIINGVLLAPGKSTVTFNIPIGTVLTGNFFARFRLYQPNAQGNCTGVANSDSRFGSAVNGEVEDYVFTPGAPTAVTITNLTARAASPALPAALAAGGLLLLAALAVVFQRQR